MRFMEGIMSKVWLVAEVGLLCGVGLWITLGSGCGAKSSLLIDDERESTDPSVDPPDAAPPRDCSTHADCDDGVYCNGDEQCVDGECDDAEPVDCGDGDACHMSYCDEERDRCIEMLIAEDRDGDGFFAQPCGEDCDDTDPAVFPGAREVCNGIDDDCDGDIDEDLVEACEDFGRRLCRDGAWTECTTCTVCIPGSRRYCDTVSYCSWGEQVCNGAGDGWGECYETSPAPGCVGYSYDQNCCMTSGSCCQDWMDYDGDGQWDDSVGACEDVICPAAD
jgi:hypothetical protein